MSTAKSSGKQIIALLLALITLLSVIPIMPVSAETLSDGKAQTVTIKLNETHYILETVGGTKLQGQSWTYTSDTGIPRNRQSELLSTISTTINICPALLSELQKSKMEVIILTELRILTVIS